MITQAPSKIAAEEQHRPRLTRPIGTIRKHAVRVLQGLGLAALLLAALALDLVSAQTTHTFTVNTSNDIADGNVGDGVCQVRNDQCTLRAALQEANAVPAGDHINIHFDLSDPRRPIRLLANLPELTHDHVTLDGLTQPGASCGALVEGTPHNLQIAIERALQRARRGLVVQGDHVTVRGLNIRTFSEEEGLAVYGRHSQVACNYFGTNFDGSRSAGNEVNLILAGSDATVSNNLFGGSELAIRVEATPEGVDNIVIQGNLIGTDATGTQALSNTNGIMAFDISGSLLIGGSQSGQGNVISGQTEWGIDITGGSDYRIEGNLIGTDRTGTTALPNGRDGIDIYGTGHRIGGTAPGAGNVISGNGRSGVRLSGTEHRVEGNFIGTTASGDAALPNAEHGVHAVRRGHVIGGTAPGAGNVISGNTLAGVFIEPGNKDNRIEGNFIGTDPTGDNAIPNGSYGVQIQAAHDNVVGGTEPGAGNVISGNGVSGVLIVGSGQQPENNRIEGNFIGVNADGSAAVPNRNRGIEFNNAMENVIGGAEPNARNIISGNVYTGIVLSGSNDANRIEGNYIGVDADGVQALPNGLYGIRISGPSDNTVIIGNVISGNSEDGILSSANRTRVEKNMIGASADGTAAIPNGAGLRILSSQNLEIDNNVISGNLIDGIDLVGSEVLNVRVRGNRIGTNLDGTAALPNGRNGISVSSGSSPHIGGRQAGEGNLISGNGQYGIYIGGTNTAVQGNIIGADVTGDAPLPNNEAGIYFFSLDEVGAKLSTIGGTSSDAANTIAFNGGPGIAVVNEAQQNAFLGNRIFQNDGLGIDLGDDGVTLNDDGDNDSGPNHGQNAPVITSAVNNGAPTATVSLTLNSLPNAAYRIELFSSPDFDPSGFGEGRTFVTAINVMTDSSGNASFNGQVPGAPLPAGSYLSATATLKDGTNLVETSEFSGAVPVTNSGS